MIDLIIYNSSFTALGLIDTQSSLLWERRFYEAGYFEIHCPATENNNALLKQGNYIMRADALESGYIQYLHKETDSDGNTDITAIGRFLSYLLHGHIIKQNRTYSGNVETVMRSLVNSTVRSGGNDGISNLYIGEDCGTTKTISIQVEYTDLHDTLKEIARRTGVGFRVMLDPNTGRLYFECYEGHDYSANQYANPQVIFSPDYDTILGDVSYTEDDSTTINAVVARYYGEFGEVVVNYNPTGASGTAKREIMISGDPITIQYPDGTVELDRTATQNALREKAKEYIAKKTVNVTAAVAHGGSFTYKEDYDIGDIVTTQYKPFGIELTRRIHRITENYTDTGIEIIPEMGEIIPGEGEI